MVGDIERLKSFGIPTNLSGDPNDGFGTDNIAVEGRNVILVGILGSSQKETVPPSAVELSLEFVGDKPHDLFPKLCDVLSDIAAMKTRVGCFPVRSETEFVEQ